MADYSRETLDQLPFSDFISEYRDGSFNMSVDQFLEAVAHYGTKDPEIFHDKNLVTDFDGAVLRSNPTKEGLDTFLQNLDKVDKHSIFENETARDCFLALSTGARFLLADRIGRELDAKRQS